MFVLDTNILAAIMGARPAPEVAAFVIAPSAPSVIVEEMVLI